jgi:hypothetical protein
MRQYKQCVLEKFLGHWKQRQTAWIPEHLAKVGKVLRVRIQEDLWDNGWLVMEVGTRMPEDYVFEHERDWRDMPTSEG